MASAFATLRRRAPCALLCAVLVYVLFLLSGPHFCEEHALESRLAELQARLQHLDNMHRTRQEEVSVLASQVASLLPGSKARSEPLKKLRPEARTLLQNLTGLGEDPGRGLTSLRLPSLYQFLPHLLDSPSSLRPAHCLSRGRKGVSVVLGVPTVRRDLQSYLVPTLRNLLGNMSPQEADDTLLVVFVGEIDQEYVLQVMKELEGKFPEQVESGLLEVVSPSAAYYPDMQSLQPNLGDNDERVRWRTKQNLDFAFLMMYAQPKGTFYVQLEDDILAKEHFISTMREFALQSISHNSTWLVIEFCQLGFIGKMFKCVELPLLIHFFLMFHKDKPGDWLLDHLIFTKICGLDMDVETCENAKSKIWLRFSPSLFQHIGVHSSLKGKIQELKDKEFGNVSLFFPHENPQAIVKSSIKHYQEYSLQKAYLGETFFWGLLPHPGDCLAFEFDTSTPIKRYFFKSGNAEHPSDILYNTTVEVLPTTNLRSYNTMDWDYTSDGYVIVGRFNNIGIAEGYIDTNLGPLKELRLHVHGNGDKWVLLSEIHIVPATNS